MNLAWFVARAAGLVAWALLALSATWGLLLSTRAMGRRPRARWLLDLHRFLGGLAVVFVGVHLVSLLADTYVRFTPAQLLVPLASEYRPVAVAFGIVALYVLIAVEVTSLLMKRMPRRIWHGVHMLSYPLFLLATVHLLTAGTDATNIVILALSFAALSGVTMFTLMRLAATRPTAVADLVAGTDVPQPSWATEPMPEAPPVLGPAHLGSDRSPGQPRLHGYGGRATVAAPPARSASPAPVRAATELAPRPLS